MISYACASTSKAVTPVAISKSKIELPQEPSSGFQEIDPENPPIDGVWLSWDDAYKLANYQREHRFACEMNIENLENEKNLCGANLDKSEKDLAKLNSSVKNWFSTWGFPIGIVIGGLIGMAVPLAIGVHK